MYCKFNYFYYFYHMEKQRFRIEFTTHRIWYYIKTKYGYELCHVSEYESKP